MTSRAEVAKKLRAKHKERTMLGLFEPQDVYFYALNYLKDLEECLPDGESAFTVLADLIDPTCQYQPNVHATWFDDNGEELEDTSLEDTANSENTYCSACGYEMMTGEEGWFDYKREEHGNRLIPNFNYCPNCGARVVRDES